MQLTDLLNRYGGIATYLVLDLVVIFLITYVLYFRRHWRAAASGAGRDRAATAEGAPPRGGQRHVGAGVGLGRAW